jgi:hypothetical protein
MEITLEYLMQNLSKFDRETPREYSIPMSIQKSILFSVHLFFHIIGVKRYFDTTPKIRGKYVDYIEITPYSKGGLWKIRCLYNRSFHLYYGTKKICWCSDLKSAIKEINRNQLNNLKT